MLADMREEYTRGTLHKSDLSESPLKQFDLWFNQIKEMGVPDANAFTLSTITKNGTPASRVVLLKGVESGSFVFFTNYLSEKGMDIESCPNVAMNFFWRDLERQVRIEGVATKLSKDASDQYFNSRPYSSQLGALASPQSEIIKSRQWLEERWSELRNDFPNEEQIKRPDHWGGYAIQPSLFEFWQGRASRLHDRFRYSPSSDQWKIDRLAP